MNSEEQLNQQYKKMTETPVSRLILALAVPTIISMLVTSIYNMADAYFVGTVGTSASGATGVVMSLMSVLQAFGFMFGHGAGSNISRRLGAQDVESARVFASTSFFYAALMGLMVLVLGMLFMDPMLYLMGSTETILPFAKDYAFWILIAGPAMTTSCVMNNILRYEGKAFFAMIGLTSGGILNIFLDWFMVSKLGMGIGGAGLATCISQYIGCLILIQPYLRGETQSTFRLSYVSHKWTEISKILSVGSPSLARQGLNAGSTMILNSAAGVYGDAAIAAMAISNRIAMFLFCVAVGIGQGFQPVSAFNYGAKKYSRVRRGFWFAFVFGVGMMFLLGIAGYQNAERLIVMFRDDPEVIEIGTTVLKMQSLVLFVMPMSIYANMLFQSIGRAKTAFVMAALRSGIVFIPVLLILNHLMRLKGLELSRPLSDALASLLSMPSVILFLRKLPSDAPKEKEST